MSRHVLVARQDSMGDVLLAGPAVRAVAAGAGRVTLLCGPRGREAGELLPGVDEVVVEHAASDDDGLARGKRGGPTSHAASAPSLSTAAGASRTAPEGRLKSEAERRRRLRSGP